jgi:hypothetical protein
LWDFSGLWWIYDLRTPQEEDREGDAFPDAPWHPFIVRGTFSSSKHLTAHLGVCRFMMTKVTQNKEDKDGWRVDGRGRPQAGGVLPKSVLSSYVSYRTEPGTGVKQVWLTGELFQRPGCKRNH